MAFKNNVQFDKVENNAWLTAGTDKYAVWKVQDGCFIVVKDNQVYGPYKRETEALSAGRSCY